MEIKVREFHAKTLLATMAVEAGYRVVLGRRAEFSKYIRFLPKGLILGFGAQKNFEKEYADLKARGFSIAVIDEEALVTFSDDIYRRLRLSEETLKNVDIVLAWGKKQKSLLPETYRDIGHVTGNLRFDILRNEYRHLLSTDISAIKERFGRIILINSSFGACNHFDGKERYFAALKEKKIIQDASDEEFYSRYFKLKEDVFNAYLKAIPLIAQRFPEHTIIVRPHPSEDYSVWHNLIIESPNIKVEHEGNIQAWLLASEVVVHHFCTTALEAFTAERPAVAYRPYQEDDIETAFVYTGSYLAVNEDELLALLQKSIDGEVEDLDHLRQEQRKNLKQRIENLDGSFAYENILKVFEQHSITTTDEISNAKIALRKFRTLVGNTYRFLKRRARPYEKSYMDHKFPSLTENEIMSFIDSVRYKKKNVSKINIKQIADFFFLLTKD